MHAKLLSKSSLKISFFLSVFIAIAAQCDISLFDSHFKISLGIILLPIFTYLLEDLSLTAVTCFSGVLVFLSRFLRFIFERHTVADSIASCYPEAFFYIVYGLLLTLYISVSSAPFKRHTDVIFFVLMDYAANLTEILLRTDVPTFSPRIHLGLLSVALVRSLITWLLISLLHRYHLVVLKKEHAERYQKLILLISKLSGEIIWMKKNTALIEDTMNVSYHLFHELRDTGADEALTKTALSVAKDIHEIKKEYNLILRGLADALDLNLQDEEMQVREILYIIRASLSASSLLGDRSCEFDFECPAKLYTDKHYFLMSIFRNLFTNALEAALPDADIKLGCHIIEQGDNYLIEISDNGPGILSEDMPEIFHPGFSTKINYSTGEVSRGLGLNLVHDLVENQFHGTITVTSRPGNTVFSMLIPKEELEAK